ncbi:PAS domain-containing protein [Leptolyngbya sp. FACHB-321]|uniref:PAS domain-containing hybrid sensor histidine kinase/response regulator n=1 Tax=Leptolyngbya sp. FACHB-321 TaxID=2692807 RepID=UPI001686A2E8|nr:PAS domain-containing protein [Leptolyngbya sp. FACHB-321]MBD2035853.1 PAS domain-containing protein [Leptolyngbya sp. FACHB-321]
MELPEDRFVGGGELGAFLRSHDWSQTPLGAVETWTEGLKAGVQILLTELDQAQQPEKTQLKTESQPPCNSNPAAPVEPTRAAAKWRESEAKYCMVLESLDEGFCLCELLFDEHGEPTDYRFLKVNAAFERLTGLEQVIGKTIRELVPDYEAYWFEIYGRVVRTREPARFEQQAIASNRWFNVHAFCLGEPQSHQFAALFTNITEAKHIEAERQKVEQERDRFLAVGSDLQIIMSSHGYFHWVSPAFEHILGWTPEEMTSRPWTDFLHPDDILVSVAESVNVLSGSETFAFENRYRHKDGSYRWLLWRAQPHLEAQVLYATAVDIHDRKQAEEALRESEIRLRFMLDASQIGEWDLDLTTEPYTAHHSLGHDQIFGYASLLPEWSYEIFLAHVHPDDRVSVNEKFQETLSASTNWNFECRILHPDQSIHWIWVRSSIYCDSDGTPTRLLGMVVDITDRKQAEATILQREAEFRQLADAMPQQVWITDAQGNTQYVNQQWTTYTGLTLEQTQDIHYATQVIHPDDFEGTSALWQTALATGTLYQAEFRLKHRTAQTYRWFLSRAIAIQNEQGQIVQWFGTSTDIEEFRRAQAEREQLLQQEQIAREAAENANRIKDEFLAVLSHELRSPLNPILGWARLLRTGNLDPARQRDALATIERNAKLQSQLIEDLLDISRIMQGKMTLTATPVSLALIISAAVETVRLAADAKQVAIVLDLDAAVSFVSGDASRLQQVVWNLLTNAVKFTPNGGQVTVKLRQVEQLAQIRVIDTGIGIKAPFLPYVFEYFRQEDGSTTRSFGGLGLGLAIVRQIVTLHGGTVTAESPGEQQGAIFTVQLPTLPQTTPLMAAVTNLQSASERLLDNVHILLVDDDTDTRKFEAFLLEQQGATVTAVDSGFAALQALEHFTPAVVISDVGMPDMDGYQLMQRLRLRPPTQGSTVPAIALTAYATDVDQQRAMQAGFQRHLTKPLDPERFVSTIISLLKPNQSEDAGR